MCLGRRGAEGRGTTTRGAGVVSSHKPGEKTKAEERVYGSPFSAHRFSASLRSTVSAVLQRACETMCWK